MKGNNKKILLIGIILIGILFSIGGTISYLIWNSDSGQDTPISFIAEGNGSCKITGSNSINNNVTLIPTNCSNSEHVIKKEIIANIDNKSSSGLYLNLWLEVNEIGSYLSDTSNFRYALTTGGSSCSDGVIYSGNFKDIQSGNNKNLIIGSEFNTIGLTNNTYYLWIWLDENETVLPPEDVSARSFNLSLNGECTTVRPDTGFEITNISSDYQIINATAVNFDNDIVSYAVTSSNVVPVMSNNKNVEVSSLVNNNLDNSVRGIANNWIDIPNVERNKIFNLEHIVSNTGTYYIWFKDSEGNTVSKSISVSNIDNTPPVCTFNSFKPNNIKNNENSVIEISCIDPETGIRDIDITNSNLNIDGNSIVITGINKSVIENGYKYRVNIKGSNIGVSNISLSNNSISNKASMGNSIVVSSDINTIDNNTMNEFTITLSNSNYVYDGSKKEPSVTVVNGSNTLVEGIDYKLEYRNNINAGVGSVLVTGINDYLKYGSKSIEFTISKANCTCTINSNISSFTIGDNASINYTCTGNGVLEVSSNKNDVISIGGFNSREAILDLLGVGTARITVKKNESINYNSCSTYKDISALGDRYNITYISDTSIDGGKTITNNVQNGDLKNKTGWSTSSSSVNNNYHGTLVNGKLLIEDTSETASYWNYQPINFIENHMYYVSAKINVIAQTYYGPEIAIRGIDGSWKKSTGILSRTTSGEENVSILATATSDFYSIQFGIGVSAVATATFSDIKVIDVTEMFGSGKEPSKEWLDEHVDNIVYFKSEDKYAGLDLNDAPNVSKTGYTLDGWTTNSDGSGEKYTNESIMPSSDLTIYANFVPNTYTLSLNPNGGSIPATSGWNIVNGIASKSINFDSSYGNLPIPTKTDYLFGGWYTGENGTGTKIESSSLYKTSNNQTLYAKWIVPEYDVTFNGNMFSTENKTINGLTITYDYESSYLTINGTPTSTSSILTIFQGLSFVENDQFNLKLDYVSGSYSYTGTGSTYFVVDIVDSNGTNMSTRNVINAKYPTSNSNNYNLSVSLLSQTNGTGLKFWIWSAEPSNLVFNNYKMKVNFTKVVTKKLRVGNQYGTLPATYRNGFNLEGWYTGENGTGTKIESTSIFNQYSNQTLYAKWKKNEFDVTFNGNMFSTESKTINGLTITYDNENSYLTINGTPNAGSTMLSIISGLNFIEGEQYKYDIKYISGTANYTGTGSASFAFEIYRLVNSSNYGAVSTRNYTASQLINSGSSTKTMTVNSASQNEGVAIGIYLWSTEPANMTYTNYKLKVNFTKVETKKVRVGNQYGTLPATYRNGFNLEGWYTGENGTGTKIENTSIFNQYSNQTLYANWTDNVVPYGIANLALQDGVFTLLLSNHGDNASGLINSYGFALIDNGTCENASYTVQTGLSKTYNSGLVNNTSYRGCIKLTDNDGNVAYLESSSIEYVYSIGSQLYSIPGEYTYLVSVNGNYKIELWGASGGGTNGGKGGYTSGNINLIKNDALYFYVGGAGNTNGVGGYNGGGNAGVQVEKNDGGGGATDFRYNGQSLNDRIMVAGGGGGANANGTNTGGIGRIGGAGGGLISYDGLSVIEAMSGLGANQLAGGSSGSSGRFPGTIGTFGFGGVGGISKNTPTVSSGGGGGGGYYGGGSGEGCASNCGGSAGGGSSYISGHTGSVAVVSKSSTSARTGTNGATCTTGTLDNQCSVHYSNKVFNSTLMIDGMGYKWTNTKGSLQQMPNPNGDYYSSGIGHVGNGAAKISWNNVNNKSSVIVTYNNNGGTGCTPKSVVKDSSYGALCVPVRNGYSFNGWYTELTGGTQVVETTTVTNGFNHTIYARWVESTNPVIVFSNNGNSDYVKGNISSRINVSKGSNNLDLSSFRYIYSTDINAEPNISFNNGDNLILENATGIYYLIVKACDVLGNCVTKKSNQFYVDNSVPTGSVTLSGQPNIINVNVSSTDLGSGINSYGYLIQTSSNCPTSGYISSTNTSYTFSITNNGNYYVCVKITDNVNNSNIIKNNINFTFAVPYNIQLANNIRVTLETGMIPVRYDMSGTKSDIVVANPESGWANYAAKQWANMVLVTDESRANYQNNVGAVINEADILGYYVWIPRYKYKLFSTSSTSSPPLIEIAFESADTSKSSGTATGEWRTHPAFTFGNTEVEGFWIGKFELTGTATAPTVKPDVSALRSQTVSSFFNIIKGISVANGTHGIKDADSHILKNSEWGAVAYLSHSTFGVGREIYINNSSSFYTGRSGGNVGGSTAINTVYTDQTSTTQYNNYGFYTWDGYLLEYGTNNKSTTRDVTKVASTTGNVYGVYDMSGGSMEYVMGYYSGHNPSTWGATLSSNYAGFTAAPEAKYYDNYTTTTNTTACNGGICYGQALSEISGWYGDYAYFVSASSPWLIRGGYYNIGANAGAFYSSYYRGSSNGIYGARVCLAFA